MEIYQPREDSYFLSEVIKDKIKKDNMKILEIGSGSGIHLKTLLKLGINKKNIFACDINDRAVKHCTKLGFNCIKSNLFSNINRKFNLIIFNPPYLSENKYDKLPDTSGGKKGDETIVKFLKQLKKHLNQNGKCFLLTSSLTPMERIKKEFTNYQVIKLATKKIFQEELYIWEIK